MKKSLSLISVLFVLVAAVGLRGPGRAGCRATTARRPQQNPRQRRQRPSR